MRAIGFAGWSGAGKTTLIVKLIPELNRRGLSVSTIKHAHHNFDLDQPGKDSYEHRVAGAEEVLVASANRVALMRELRGAPEPSLAELFRLLKDVDLVLVEGFKRDPLPKIEISRAANGKPPLYPDDRNIVALISDLAQGAVSRGVVIARSAATKRSTGTSRARCSGSPRRPSASLAMTMRHPKASASRVNALPHASIDDIAAAADLVLAHAKPGRGDSAPTFERR